MRNDPGPCAICGAAHAACNAGDESAPILVTQLPARDGVEMRQPEPVTVMATAFSTAMYRRKTK